ncbi:MAG: 3'-5' exonuclease [Endomicrobiales bacterium]|jgi:DNA polymerase-3 subunit epsilon
MIESFPHPLAFLDVETTGLCAARHDKVCEIAILRVDKKGLREWQSLVNPGIPIPPFISQINGITDDMVQDAPRFSAVTESIVNMIEDAVVVCHNAPFDLGFLTAEFVSCQTAFPCRPFLDTLSIARSHFPFPSNSLSNIASHLHIPVTTKHRALADVNTTYRIFDHFCSVIDSAVLLSLIQSFGKHSAKY